MPAHIRAFLGLGGALLFAAGPLHPDPQTYEGLEAAMLSQLRQESWLVSHALLLVSYGLIAAGLVGLARRWPGADAARPFLVVAAVGAVGGVVEMVPHLAAVAEADALAAGAATPILATHLALATVVYPVMGLPLAAFALLAGWRGGLGARMAAAVGAIGALFHALAPPIIVLSRDPSVAPLFTGITLMSIWLIAVALRPGLLTTVPGRLVAAPPA